MEDISEVLFDLKKISNLHWAITVKQDDRILLVDKINLVSEKARNNFLEKLLREFPGLQNNGVEDKLKEQLMLLAVQAIEKNQKGDLDVLGGKKNEPLHQSLMALDKTEQKIVDCAEEFLKRPDLAVQIVKQVQALGVAGEKELILMLYLIGTSRLLPRPLAGVVMGASSAGKSYVINRVASLFPEETVLQAHRITPRALEHMPAGSLVHRFVVAGERSRKQDDEAAEATRALREMISDGKLSLAISEKSSAGKWETVHIEQQGPISYVESTTLGLREIFDEDRTRLVLLSSDERKSQTEAVINQLAETASKPNNPDTPDSIIALHYALQRLLLPYDVIVPYASKLTECLPSGQLAVRRTFGHLLSFIQSVALLYQFQREMNDDNRIIATIDDYDVVRNHLSGPLARSLGCELTPGAKDLYNFVEEYGEFTIPKITSELHLSENTVRGRIKELEQAGQINMTQKGRGSIAAEYNAVDNPPPLHGLVLPSPTELMKINTVSIVPELTENKT